MMAMPSKNKKRLSSPVVVSTDCSGFKPFFHSCCRHLSHSKLSPRPPNEPNSISNKTSSLLPPPPPPPPPNTSHHNPTSLHSSTPLPSPNCFRDGREAAQAYWRRAKQLELELIQLDMWLNMERELRDRLDDNCGTYPSEPEMKRNPEDCMKTELKRLADGSYFIEITKFNGPWRSLAMQISAPAVVPVEIDSNISQILHRMVLMGTHNLQKWLLKSMPMCEISGIQEEGINSSSVTPGSEESFMEGVVLGSIEKIEILVLESLRIQMGVKGRAKEVVWEKRDDERGREYVVVVMLIQVRDAEKKNEAVGEVMIGLVEVSVGQGEESGFLIEGVHVAGIGGVFKENKRFVNVDGMLLGMRRDVKGGEQHHLWSVSFRRCKGRSSCSCWECVRNPNIAFP